MVDKCQSNSLNVGVVLVIGVGLGGCVGLGMQLGGCKVGAGLNFLWWEACFESKIGLGMQVGGTLGLGLWLMT